MRIAYRRLLAPLVFLVLLTSDVPAQDPARSAQKPAEPSAFAGCYELKLGPWWPTGFGEDNMFATPPAQIQLLPILGTEGFEKNGLLVRPFPDAPESAFFRRRYSYWRIQTGDTVQLIWTTGFSGVVINLARQGRELSGWAHPFWDFPRFPRIAHVTAKRFSCEPAQEPRAPASYYGQ
jgi:hypothetical protein